MGVGNHYLDKMAVHLSPEAKHEVCELIAEKVEENKRKLYPTLAEAGIKGPTFYAYLKNESVPSDEATTKLISLGIALDREGTLEIIRGELEDLSDLVEEVTEFTSTTLSRTDDILKTITSIGRVGGKTSEEKEKR